jgi:NAD(P)H-dependent FMN reductase
MIRVAIIEGTTRQGRRSLEVAKYIQKTLSQIPDLEVDLIDPVEQGYTADEKLMRENRRNDHYHTIVQEADAYILVIPEYNHSFPGTLKILLDSEKDAYKHKPVLLAGVSSGPWGGVRAIQSILPVARELGMIVSSEDLYFPMVHQLVNQGTFQDQGDTQDRIIQAGKELIWLAKTLQWGRTQIEQE